MVAKSCDICFLVESLAFDACHGEEHIHDAEMLFAMTPWRGCTTVLKWSVSTYQIGGALFSCGSSAST